jgi:very-short-patch-repair endonuclease
MKWEGDKAMYYNAKPVTFSAAKILRDKMTVHETLLWERINNKQICGLRFRRQHPIDFFIADFYCHTVRLVVEIDGNIHNGMKEYDIGRSAEMDKYFITVIRFTNDQVENKIDEVVNEIENVVCRLLKVPLGGFRGINKNEPI